MIFWTKFALKGCFQSKTEKVNTTIEFCIFNLHFLDQICPKRVFPVKTEKSEHDQWILHIRIYISTKFQLKLTVLIFWTNLPKKGISGNRKIAFLRASKRYFDFSSQRLLTFTSFKRVLRYWANLLACLCAFDFEPQLVIFKHVLN